VVVVPTSLRLERDSNRPDKDRIPMKRFLFWFALTLVGMIFLLKASRQQVAPPREPVVVRLVSGPDGLVRNAHVNREGKVIALTGVDDENDFDRDSTVRREPAEGLPVPVVPGTRTTEARVEPPSARDRVRTYRKTATSTPDPVERSGVHGSPELTSVTGRLSATEERARDDARHKLERLLSEKLAPEVPLTWKAPTELIDGMIRQIVVVPRERDYGTVYEATLKVDLSAPRLARIVEAYHREEVAKRLALLGALLMFVLVCLAVVSGYINADEATKGYYTNRLRLAAAAGVGAAGVVLYRMLA